MRHYGHTCSTVNKSLCGTNGVFSRDTPGLRDLSHSAPYIHNGQFDTLEDVIELYRTTSTLERARALRNGADELAGIALAPSDVSPLAAFLRSLNEDYQ
jgi:cytochrome c peroxidase